MSLSVLALSEVKLLGFAVEIGACCAGNDEKAKQKQQ